MARPKLGDSESKRLQMVITEDELKAIEDWRFEKRVQSKSDAIRRLVQVGLRVDRAIPTLIRKNVDATRQIWKIIEVARAKVGKENNPDVDALIDIIRSMFKDIERMGAMQLLAADSFFDLLSEIAPMMNAEKFSDLAEALKAANNRRAEVVEGGHAALTKILANFGREEGRQDEG